MDEWLRCQAANLVGIARVRLNRTVCAFAAFLVVALQAAMHLWWPACSPGHGLLLCPAPTIWAGMCALGRRGGGMVQGTRAQGALARPKTAVHLRIMAAPV